VGRQSQCSVGSCSLEFAVVSSFDRWKSRIGKLTSSVVIKFGIYRKGNDIKMGVIPRHEESLEVQLEG
jgi:hypothetical protein